MEKLVVGQEVTLRKAMLGEPVGSKGYVYEVYQDFDEPEKDAVSIIFSNGGYDGFSIKEQELFLEVGRVDQRYTMYQFKNVNQVYKDFQHGYWKF